MGLLDFLKPKTKKKLVKEITIQGAHVEGIGDGVMIESLLTGTRFNVSIPGVTNAYTSYESQVYELYRKYNGEADFGSPQVRAIIDLRTAFIAGEGISISSQDEGVAAWMETFLRRNELDGTSFINAVKGSELAGQALYLLRPRQWLDDSLYIDAQRFPYIAKRPFRPVWEDPLLRSEVIDIEVKNEMGVWVRLGLQTFVYVRTGGDDTNSRGPTTRAGLVLTDTENYDRALRDMRRNNHVMARITPTFKTENQQDAKDLKTQLETIGWKIGQAYMGSAEFDYATPGTGAHENLTSELTSTIKSMSSVTGVPVHWLGFVDLMSNRSTAESLYELIKNGTINERAEWKKALYRLLVAAQIMYIDNGGLDLPRVDFDFEVDLPLIDFSKFLDLVRGLSIAKSDNAISMQDYRSALPGINPLQTEREVRAEQEEQDEATLLMARQIGVDDDVTEEEETEDDG